MSFGTRLHPHAGAAGAASPSAPASAGAGGALALALFGIGRAGHDLPPDLAGAGAGVFGPVLPMAEGPLVAWVAAVDAARIRQLAADPAAVDPAWLHAAALAHEHITRTLHLQAGALLPSRFGTLVTGGRGSLSPWLQARAPLILAALDSLCGVAEYRVTVSAPALQATGASPAQTPDAQTRDAQTRDAQTRDAQTRDAETRPAASGRAFLAQRLGERKARRTALAHRDEQTARALQALEAVAANPGRLRALEPARAQPAALLRAALLLDGARSGEAHAAHIARHLADHDLADCEVSLSGPHAPFSFVPDDLAGRPTVGGEDGA